MASRTIYTPTDQNATASASTASPFGSDSQQDVALSDSPSDTQKWSLQVSYSLTVSLSGGVSAVARVEWSNNGATWTTIDSLNVDGTTSATYKDVDVGTQDAANLRVRAKADVTNGASGSPSADANITAWKIVGRPKGAAVVF